MPTTPTGSRKQGTSTRIAIPVQEAAERLSISRAHLYKEIKLGRLPTVKLGGRRLVRVVDLYSYLEANLDQELSSEVGECASNLDK